MVSEGPRVAHVLIPYLRKTETFIYDRLIRHSRYQPFILTDEPVVNQDLFPFGNPIYSLAEKATPVRAFDVLSKKSLGISPYFIRTLSRLKPSVIHAHYGPVGAAVAPAAKLLGIPLVVSFYGIDASAFLDSPEYKTAYKRLFRIASVVSVLSGDMAERLVRAGCQAKKIRVHHLAVDTDVILPRQKTRTPDRPFRIVAVGRFVPKKGMSLLVNSFELLLNKGVSAELHIYGDGPLENEVKRQVAEKQLGAGARLFGHQGRDAVLDAMRNADVFALFSVTGPDGDREGTPTVLIEAGALGLPSVSTRHAGIPEVVENGRTGFLVDEFDEESFAERLERLAANPELRGAMGAAARVKVVSEFDIKSVMSAIESDYDSIISKR